MRRIAAPLPAGLNQDAHTTPTGRRWRLHELALACALTLGALSAAAQSLPSPLVDATKAAVLGSPDVQERWRAFRGSEALVPMARAAWLPTADLSASVGRGDGSQLAAYSGVGSYSYNSTQLALSQLLFDGGVATSAIRSADHQRLRSFRQLQETSEAVALQVVKAYLDVLRGREALQSAADNYAEHKSTANALGERVQAAVSRRVDLEQATARVAKSETALVNATQDLHNAEAHYLRIVGQLPPKALPSWPEGLEFAIATPSVGAALQQGLPNNPTLLASVENLKSAQEDAAGRSAAFMPQLKARLTDSRSSNLDGQLGPAGMRSAELRLNANLYRGGADSANKANADALAQRAQDQVQETCREVQQTLSVAFNDIGKWGRLMRQADQHRTSVDKSRTAFRQQFDIGQRTLLDLLDTQNEFFDTERTFIGARYDHLYAQARTLAAMGRLVQTLSATRTDVEVSPADQQALSEQDVATYCPAQAATALSLDKILAELEPPKKVQRSFVVLLPDPDGKVGSVIVKGAGGEQVISQAAYGSTTSGEAPAQAVSAAEIDNKFGAAIQAQPPLPDKFTLYFVSGQTRLSPESEAQWQQILAKMRERKTIDITVAGYTDTMSTDQVNDRLALKRAQAVAARLRKSGFKNIDIAVVGFGSKQLQVPTPPQTSELHNRRVVITAR